MNYTFNVRESEKVQLTARNSLNNFCIARFVLYGDRQVMCSVHLVLSWPWHNNSWEHDNMSWPRDINLWECHNSWERDIMSWPQDHFVEVTTSLCRGLEMLCWGNDIHYSWPLLMLREWHIFLVATSLMRKQTCVTIATRDYQKWIIFFY